MSSRWKSKSHCDLKTTVQLMANNYKRSSSFVSSFPANLVAARRDTEVLRGIWRALSGTTRGAFWQLSAFHRASQCRARVCSGWYPCGDRLPLAVSYNYSILLFIESVKRFRVVLKKFFIFLKSFRAVPFIVLIGRKIFPTWGVVYYIEPPPFVFFLPYCLC